jgi:hypothetical protein
VLDRNPIERAAWRTVLQKSENESVFGLLAA